MERFVSFREGKLMLDTIKANIAVDGVDLTHPRAFTEADFAVSLSGRRPQQSQKCKKKDPAIAVHCGSIHLSHL